MITKTTKYKSGDEFDVDRSLDLPEFDFEGYDSALGKKKKKDGPVTDVVKNFVKGIGDSIINPGIIETTLRRSFPKEYGVALDIGQQGVGSVRSLYNQATKELRPSINALKQTTRQILPKTEGILPKKIQARIRDWSKSDNGAIPMSEDRMRDQALAVELGSIFKDQAEDADRRQDAQDRRDQVRETIEQLRHRDSMGRYSEIAESSTRVAEFQDKIHTPVLKKQLELQMRQYYVLGDILKETKLGNIQRGRQLEAVVHNTALPDYDKLSTSKLIKQNLRNKFVDIGQNALFGKEGNFLGKFINNIKDDLSNKVTGAAQTGGMLTSLLDMMVSMGSMGGDDTSTKGTIARFMGSFGADTVVGKAQDKLKTYLDKNPHVQKGAEHLGYATGNADNLVRDYLSNPKNKLGPLEPLREYFLSQLPKTGPETTLDVASIANANQPAVYSNAAQKSLVEVIPGLLARILREQTMARTGKDVSLISYDYAKNKFTSQGNVGTGVREAFTNQGNREAVKERFGQMFGRIDQNKELSEEDRAQVQRELLSRAIKGQSTDSKVLANARTWEHTSNAKGISTFFQKHLRTNAFGKRDDSLEAIRNQRQLSDEIGRVTRFFNDPRAILQEMARLGQLDEIESSGLYNRETNQIDLDKIVGGLLGDEVKGVKPTGDREHLGVGENRMPTFVQGDTRHALNRRPTAEQVENRRKAEQARKAAAITARREAMTAQPVAPGPVQQTTVQATVDTKALEVLFKQQIDEIKKIDPNANLQAIIDILKAMDGRLEKGINTYSLSEDYLGPDARARMKDRFGRLREKVGKATDTAKEKLSKLNPMNLTLGDLVSGAAGVASAGLKFGAKIAGTIPGIAKTVGGLAVSGSKSVLSAVNKVTQKVADKFGDLYVGEEKNPRLTYARLKQGIYYFTDPELKQPLKSFKDIKGPIYDEEGNEILNEEDFEKSYIKGSRITVLKEIAGTGFKWGTAIGNQAVRALGTFYGTAVNLGIGAIRLGIKLLPPYDVYVKGEEKPRLTAGGFKAGLYFSEKTKNPLKHPREIDGPVVDQRGDHLIDQDDFEKGLVDKNGLTVTNKVARAFGKIKQAAGLGIRALKGIAGTAKEFLVGIGQAMKDIFSGVFGLRGEYLKTSQKQLDVQLKILQLLTERLPERKKKIFGDSDGDGIRDNSAADIERKQAAADKAKEEEKKKGQQGDDTSVGGSRGGGLLSKLAGLFGKKKKDEDEKGESLLEEAGDVANIYDAVRGNRGAKAAEAAGKGGRFSRMLGGAGKALKFAGKAAGVAGLAYGGYSAVKNFNEGNYGSAALDAGLTGVGAVGMFGGLSGLASLAGGVGTVAAGAAGLGGTVLGALGTGLGAIISSPILLPALGVAAVAGAGYLAYKYFTQPKLTPLNKVRFAQYGFSEQDESRLKTIIGLEQALQDKVKFEGQSASIDEKGIDLAALMGPFGVTGNSNYAPTWLSWFANRFKPVFLGHMAALRGINPEVKLAEADSKLKPDEKLKYLDASSMSGGPYDFTASPFPEMKNLSVTSSGVRAAIELARDDFKKEVDKQPKEDAKTAAAAAVAGKQGTNVDTAKAPASAAGAPASAAIAAGATGVQALKEAAGVGGAGMQTQSAGTAISLDAKSTVPSDFIFTGQKGQIDAFTAVRMKAYGLVDMEIAKMRDLAYLEKRTFKSVTFAKDTASFSENVEDLLVDVGPKFGISSPHTEEGMTWIRWYRSRFLPVFLNYCTLLKKATGKDDYVKAEMAVTPQQQLDVANGIIATAEVYRGSKVPVWDVPDSPWRSYATNPDAKSTDQNIDALTQTVKAVKAGEQNAPAKQIEAAKNAADAQKAGTAAKPTPFLTDPLNTKYNKAKENLAAGAGYIQPDKLDSSGKGVRGVGDYETGVEVTHPGKGTGGDINSIPMPDGNTWKGMKPMLEAVSKMTGVDVNTLATIVAIESGFDPNARPMSNGRLLSSAAGLFQFIDGTWNDMLRKYGAKYGIAPNTPKTDPRANALLGAEFTKENITGLKSRLKKNITTTDVYMAHFLGLGGSKAPGAVDFLNADPNTIGAQVMPAAANANPGVFYDKQGNPRTLGEIYKHFNGYVEQKLKKFNVTDVPVPTADMKSASETAKTSNTQGTADTGPGDALSKDQTAAKPNTGAAAMVASTPAPTSAVATQTTVPVQTPAAQAQNSGGGYTAAATTIQKQAMPEAQPQVPQTPTQRPALASWGPRATPTSAELNAQSDAQRKSIADGVLTIGQTLLDSKDIQGKILTQLMELVKNQNAKVSQPAADVSKPAANASPTDVPRQAPKAPVSMTRNY